MSIIKKTKKANEPTTGGIDSIKREAEFIPHFVYSSKNNEIIDSIYLTEDQAYALNKLMKRNGHEQDIVFLRK